MLDPPPPGVYDELDALMQAANLHAKQQGYAVVKQRTKKDKKGQLHKVYLRCDRGGKYLDKANPYGRTRYSGTRLIDCPFSAIGTLKEGQWYLDIHQSDHNHDGTMVPAAHPQHRQLSTVAQQSIASMSEAGVAPQAIISSIRLEDPEVAIQARDVYNACS